ncbi:unnamed protein product, partial [Mesorhabditis spiculigera]
MSRNPTATLLLAAPLTNSMFSSEWRYEESESCVQSTSSLMETVDVCTKLLNSRLGDDVKKVVVMSLPFEQKEKDNLTVETKVPRWRPSRVPGSIQSYVLAIEKEDVLLRLKLWNDRTFDVPNIAPLSGLLTHLKGLAAPPEAVLLFIDMPSMIVAGTGHHLCEIAGACKALRIIIWSSDVRKDHATIQTLMGDVFSRLDEQTDVSLLFSSMYANRQNLADSIENSLSLCEKKATQLICGNIQSFIRLRNTPGTTPAIFHSIEVVGSNEVRPEDLMCGKLALTGENYVVSAMGSNFEDSYALLNLISQSIESSRTNTNTVLLCKVARIFDSKKEKDSENNNVSATGPRRRAANFYDQPEEGCESLDDYEMAIIYSMPSSRKAKKVVALSMIQPGHHSLNDGCLFKELKFAPSLTPKATLINEGLISDMKKRVKRCLNADSETGQKELLELLRFYSTYFQATGYDPAKVLRSVLLVEIDDFKKSTCTQKSGYLRIWAIFTGNADSWVVLS